MVWLDKLKGFREIGAFVMMGVLGLSILRGLTRLLGGDYSPGFATRAYYAQGNFVEAAAAVVLVLLVLSLAVQPPKSPRVGLLAMIGAIVTGVGVVCDFLFGLIGLGAEIFDGIGRVQYLLHWLVTLIVPAVATVVLLLVYLGNKPAPTYQHPQSYDQQQSFGGQSPFPGVGQPGQQAPGQQAPGQQPTWQPDQASGGAWQSAGQAASGASATEWGQPGQQQGWGQPSAAEPPAEQQQSWAPQQSATEPPAQQGWGQPSAADPQQQAWGQPSAAEPPQQAWAPQSATEPPAQQWQPVDPNQQPGGYQQGGPQQGGYQQ